MKIDLQQPLGRGHSTAVLFNDDDEGTDFYKEVWFPDDPTGELALSLQLQSLFRAEGYIIRDMKLVRHVDEKNHPEVILQLQLYGWLYEHVFGHPPLRLEVFNGQSELVVVPTDIENLQRHLRKIVELKTLTNAPYDPVGWSKCLGCGFHDWCWKKAKAGNDVALVLGVPLRCSQVWNWLLREEFNTLIRGLEVRSRKNWYPC